MKKISKWLWIMILTTLLGVASCKLGRFVVYNFADVNDYKRFPSRPLLAHETPFKFFETTAGKFPKKVGNKSFDEFLEDRNTLAFIIIKNDTIQYEKYFDNYQQNSWVPSFSVAKSVSSILIGCAIDDGFIKSVDEPITNYIPELKDKGFDKVTIKHVLQMTSGLDFNESYVNPFGHAASFYYGLNLRKEISKLKLKNTPGTTFDYVSGNSQLLGLILERSLMGKTVTAYLQERIWTPLGMEYNASWSMDQEENGLEKTFCCLNACARDFAKIGRLYKNKGNWNGKQIISEKWVMESTKLDTTEGSAPYYQYQWWLPKPGEGFVAVGILGQYIYVNPKKDIVIVRLGKNKGGVEWRSFFRELANAY